jgi:hypothetical protein
MRTARPDHPSCRTDVKSKKEEGETPVRVSPSSSFVMLARIVAGDRRGIIDGAG